MNAMEKLTQEGIGFEVRYIKNNKYDVFSGGTKQEKKLAVPIRFVNPDGKAWAKLKFLKRDEPHVNEGKWRIYFVNGDRSMLFWDKKDSFLGDTLEEACEKAYDYYIKHIKPKYDRYEVVLKEEVKYTEDNPAVVQL